GLRREYHRHGDRLSPQALRQSHQLLLAGTPFLRVEMEDDPNAAAHAPPLIRPAVSLVRAWSKGNGVSPAAARPSRPLACPPAPGGRARIPLPISGIPGGPWPTRRR